MKRDEIDDYVRKWTAATEVTSKKLLGWIGLWSSTYSNWTRNYGKAYEHDGWIPRDHWREGRHQAIFDERDRKLAEARQRRAEARAAARTKINSNSSLRSKTSYTCSDATEWRQLFIEQC